MNSLLIFSCSTSPKRQSFNVFHVGEQQEYLSYQKQKEDYHNNIHPRLETFISFAQKNLLQTPFAFACSARDFILMQEETPQTFAKLQSLLTQANVELLGVPCYGSSSLVTSKQEFSTQIRQQQTYTQQHFRKKASYFFTAHSTLSRDALDALSQHNFRGILSSPLPKTNTITWQKAQLLSSPIRKIPILEPIPLSPSSRLQATAQLRTLPIKSITPEILASLLQESNMLKAVSLQNVFTSTTPRMHNTSSHSSLALHPLQEHLLKELNGLYTYIKQTGDATLLDDWRLLAQPSLFTSQSPTQLYETYGEVMHICNDIAHKIASVELAKQGMFSTQATISHSPLQMLKELYTRE